MVGELISTCSSNIYDYELGHRQINFIQRSKSHHNQGTLDLNTGLVTVRAPVLTVDLELFNLDQLS